MPEITGVHVALLVLGTVIGLLIGWMIRGNRSVQEKAAINAGWHERSEAQGAEHHRLVIQNRQLMDQISQYQAANREAKKRTKKLTEAAQEASARRDELQREIKDIREDFETTLTERDRLQTENAALSDDDVAMQQKDEKIFQLSRELENWQSRLPPLIERYRVRNDEAVQLENDLAEAHERIAHLQDALDKDSTRIETSGNPGALSDGRDASNDSIDGRANSRVRDVATANDYDHDHDHDHDHDNNREIHRDDLKQIKGIGPSIEKTLNEMGIYRFEQIADMSEYDIDRVAQRLRGFHSRIYREDWIGQARDLNDHDRSA